MHATVDSQHLESDVVADFEAKLKAVELELCNSKEHNQVLQAQLDALQGPSHIADDTARSPYERIEDGCIAETTCNCSASTQLRKLRLYVKELEGRLSGVPSDLSDTPKDTRTNVAIESAKTEMPSTEVPVLFSILGSTRLKVAYILNFQRGGASEALSRFPPITMPPRQSLVVNISKKCKDPIQYMTQEIKNLCSGDGFYFCPGHNRVLWYPYIEHHAIVVSPKAKYLSKPEGGVMVDEWTDYDEFSESIGQVRELLYRGEDHRIYYGGTYKFALVGDLSQTEFSTLPQSIRDELIRVTFVDPKFVTTPGEKGKIRKMYLSGNAQAVYLALQCVGFNKPLYDALIQTFP